MPGYGIAEHAGHKRQHREEHAESKNGDNYNDIRPSAEYRKEQTQRADKNGGSQGYAKTGDDVIPGHTAEDADNCQQRQTYRQK
ncbi:hypothetical protein ES703_119134 [subsurface metagenome]